MNKSNKHLSHKKVETLVLQVYTTWCFHLKKDKEFVVSKTYEISNNAKVSNKKEMKKKKQRRKRFHFIADLVFYAY